MDPWTSTRPAPQSQSNAPNARIESTASVAPERPALAGGGGAPACAEAVRSERSSGTCSTPSRRARRDGRDATTGAERDRRAGADAAAPLLRGRRRGRPRAARRRRGAGRVVAHELRDLGGLALEVVAEARRAGERDVGRLAQVLAAVERLDARRTDRAVAAVHEDGPAGGVVEEREERLRLVGRRRRLGVERQVDDRDADLRERLALGLPKLVLVGAEIDDGLDPVARDRRLHVRGREERAAIEDAAVDLDPLVVRRGGHRPRRERG